MEKENIILTLFVYKVQLVQTTDNIEHIGEFLKINRNASTLNIKFNTLFIILLRIVLEYIIILYNVVKKQLYFVCFL